MNELSKVAQTVSHGKYVKVDKYGFLVFHYTSNSGKTKYSTQCEIDGNGQLSRMSYRRQIRYLFLGERCNLGVPTCSREPYQLKSSRYGTGAAFYEQVEEMYI